MPMSSAKIGFSASIPRELKAELDIIAEEERRSFNNLVTIILEDYVKEKRKVQIKDLRGEKRATSSRIGVAKGKLHVPSEFADWDKEVESLFEDGDLI